MIGSPARGGRLAPGGGVRRRAARTPSPMVGRRPPARRPFCGPAFNAGPR